MDGLEILVLGDGRFVWTVLNAVSSIGRGDYGRLAALGAMLGLVGMVLRGAMSPQGPKFDPTVLLVSILMFWVIFIPRVDRVMVVEMMPPPGGDAARTYVVDNVPLGLAAAGYFVSNVGLGITGLYDTIMGRADDTDRVLTGGLGRNLMLMAGIREMVADPRFGQGAAGGEFGFYRQNMVAYLQDCTVPTINNGYVDSAKLLRTPLEEGVFGPEFAQPIAHTYYRNDDGSGSEYVTCAVAQGRLRAGMSSGDLIRSFDAAAEDSRFRTNSDELVSTFSQMAGANALHAQHLVVGHMINSVIREAQVRGSVSPLESQAVIMVEEANLRRSTQWAAEENLFVRLLRPMVGFFEALFYALAPIMAFVVTLGPVGMSLLSKYLMLTVWVALWFPMLTITQLYSKIRMEDYFEQLGRLDTFTPHQLELIANEATTVLGATSALVAATPALAMSLIYGGAVSMSYLSRSLSHGDVVDEEKMAPKAQQVGPALNSAGLANYSGGAGGGLEGRAGISLTSNQGISELESSTAAEAATKQATAQQDFYRAIENNASIVQSGGTFGRTSESVDAANRLQNTLSQQEGMSQTEREGAALIRGLSTEDTARLSQAAEYSRKHGVDLSVGLKKFGVGAGYGYSETRGQTETDEHSQSSRDSLQLNDSKAIEAAMDFAYREDEQYSSAVGRATVAEAGHVAQNAGTLGLSTADGERLSRSVSEAQSATQTHQLASTMNTSRTDASEITVRQLAENMRGKGAMETDGAAAVAMVDRAGGRASEIRERERARLDNSDFIGTSSERHAMASLMALNHAGDHIPSAMRGDANALVTTVLATHSTLGTGAVNLGSGDAQRFSGVGGGAHDVGGVAQDAGSIHGAGVGSEQVRASAAGAIGGANTEIASQQADLGAQADGAGVVDTGHHSLAGRVADAERTFDARAEKGQSAHIASSTMADVELAESTGAKQFADQVIATSEPEARTNMFGSTVQPTGKDWAGSVQSMSTAANQLDSKGHNAEADRVREAQTDRVGSMMGSLQQEYPQTWESASREYGGNGVKVQGHARPEPLLEARTALLTSNYEPTSPEVQWIDSRLHPSDRLSSQQEASPELPSAALPRRPNES